LRHVIQIHRATVAPDAYGTPVETWGPLATLRADLVSRGTAETVAGAAGAIDLVELVFHTRIFSGVTLADRVQFQGVVYNLTKISGGDFREGRGLELHCGGRP
jgi:head-tail adaptor